MDEKYKIEQPIAYQILSNSINSNKFFHAYLFEKNDYENYYNFIIEFVKNVICPNIKNKDCIKCNICNSIDKNEYIELKVINPDGQWIKKSQIDELQEEFSKKNIIGKNKVYIIDDADKLNSSAANSLLKFLEEPNQNIIGVLIAKKSDDVLQTIVSRSQVIGLRNYLNFSELSLHEKIINLIKIDKNNAFFYQNDDNFDKNLQKIVNFVLFLEKNNEKTICYINQIIPEIYEKENFNIIMTIILNIYKDVLYTKIDKKMQIFIDFSQKLDEICQKNTINSLIKKISVILEIQDNLKYNANLNLSIDKFIIEMSRCNNNE